MEDLSAKLSQILGSEEGMAQLRGMAAALGLGGNGPQQSEPQAAPPPPQNSGEGSGGPDLSALASMLSGLMGGSQSQQPQNSGPSLPNIDMKTIATLQQAYATFTAPDKNTELLMALKPHFAPERQKKVDDAVRIIGLVKLLPLLKESGILGNLFGGDKL